MIMSNTTYISLPHDVQPLSVPVRHKLSAGHMYNESLDQRRTDPQHSYAMPGTSLVERVAHRTDLSCARTALLCIKRGQTSTLA